MLAHELRAHLRRSETHRRRVLVDIGSGSGYPTLWLLRHNLADYGVLVDISPCAVASCWSSAKINGLDHIVDVIQCDAASCLRSTAADVVLFNPPYIPVEEWEEWIGYSWSGGREGLEVTLKFLGEAIRICGNHEIYFIASTLQNVVSLFSMLNESCEVVEILECRDLFFETLCVIRVRGCRGDQGSFSGCRR